MTLAESYQLAKRINYWTMQATNDLASQAARDHADQMRIRLEKVARRESRLQKKNAKAMRAIHQASTI